MFAWAKTGQTMIRLSYARDVSLPPIRSATKETSHLKYPKVNGSAKDAKSYLPIRQSQPSQSSAKCALWHKVLLSRLKPQLSLSSINNGCTFSAWTGCPSLSSGISGQRKTLCTMTQACLIRSKIWRGRAMVATNQKVSSCHATTSTAIKSTILGALSKQKWLRCLNACAMGLVWPKLRTNLSRHQCLMVMSKLIHVYSCTKIVSVRYAPRIRLLTLKCQVREGCQSWRLDLLRILLSSAAR